MPTITPTVGRVVHYHTGTSDQPCAAIVAYVWSDRLVNIGYFDSHGVARQATSIPLLQEGDEPPKNKSHCTWMAYQVGQAAKTEELEKRVAAQASAEFAKATGTAKPKKAV